MFVVGRKVTAVVLKEMPFDGHLLRYGNEDLKVWGIADIPNPKGKGTRRRATWSAAAAAGAATGSPAAGAEASSRSVSVGPLRSSGAAVATA